MGPDFSRCLTLLRKEKGISQRAAAKELGISQALLSHYENGIREPGLTFVTRSCDFYGVSADFLLGRTLARDGTTIVDANSLYDDTAEKNNVMRGNIMANLSKKLLINSMSLVFDLLGETGSKNAVRSASEYLSTAIYKVFRHLHRAEGTQDEQFFSVPTHSFLSGLPTADMLCSEAEYAAALAEVGKRGGPFPEMSHAALTQTYPGPYQSLLQIVHTTGERVNGQVAARAALRK